MATLPPLATLSDLGDRLSLTELDDARASAILDDVSAIVRSYTGRDFVIVTGEVETVDICNGVATLRNGPVISVDAVTSGGDAVDFTWTRGRRVTIMGDSSASVTYTYGWEFVPADIIAVVCQMAGRAYGTLATDSGVSQVSLGSYSETTGTTAASGPAGMLPDERSALDHYRPGSQSGTIRLSSWV